MVPHVPTPPKYQTVNPIIDDDAIRMQAYADFRNATAEDLVYRIDVLEGYVAIDDADPIPDEPEVLWIARVQLDAARGALARLRRLHHAGKITSDPDAPRSPDWSQLARRVRDEADIVRFLSVCGHEMRRVGHSVRAGADEYAGACPVCGGHDRFRAWESPANRCWCRRCGWSTDVVGLVACCIPSRAGDWRRAVRFIAEELGIPVDAEPPVRGVTVPQRQHGQSVTFLPIRSAKGGRRVG